MFKKCVLKVSNTLSTINYMLPNTKTSSSRSSTASDEDGSGSACSCNCNYNLMEVNRDLFIENYLIGRGGSKMRSSSLTAADDALKEAAHRRNNHRRKSFIEKRDDRLKINRNHLFTDKRDKMDRAVTRHKISTVDMYRQGDDDDDCYEMDDEKSLGCDFIEQSAPTLKKINNKLRDFVDVELSISLPISIFMGLVYLFIKLVKLLSFARIFSFI
jgi:hypothetical protein